MCKHNFSIKLLIIILSILFSGNSFSITRENQKTKQFVVVIDPGHGGKDPGAISKSIREKDVVLGIGLKLGKLINENYSDVKVVFTRNSDVFIPLIDRSRIANKAKADLFISLHANICKTPSTRGTETFTLGPNRLDANFEVVKTENSVILLEEDYSTTYEGFDPNSIVSYIMFENMQSEYMDQSILFADDIQQQFKSRLESTDRSVKQAGFLVLKMSSMPSVLIETGFLSNPGEANYLKSEEGQQNIALSILAAFKKFKSRNSVNTNVSVDENIASQEKIQEKKEEPSVDQANNQNKANDTIAAPIIAEKVEKGKTENIVASKVPTDIKATENNSYFSVQIGANTTPVEPNAANFKGLKDVRREKTDKYYRYYVGKENSIDNLTAILEQVKKKFPQAFIVSFVDGKRILLK